MKPSWSFRSLRRPGATRRRIRRLVLDLEHPESALETALRRALGDDDLCVAFRIPGGVAWVDSSGAPVELPPAGSDRSVTPVEGPEGPLAVLVHDPSVSRDRRLLQAVAAAARLALENDRLEAELRARIAEVRASRRRLVATGDAERRRIERDLHDGAQQRLVSVAIGLQMVRLRLGTAEDQETELLGRGIELAQRAIEDLRRIAEGVFPVTLAEEGLGAALEDFAASAPVPVELEETPASRIDASAEAVAYFAAAEVVAGIARVDPGAQLRLAARVAHEHLELTVKSSAGMVGAVCSPELEDRVDAVGGIVTVAPTRVLVRIPTAGDEP